MHLVQVPVAEITLRAGESEPRNLETLPELVASIRELGLLNPITITTENRLVAGRRRLAACKEIGWESIPAVQIAFQELHTELAAIDENICRAELTVLERSDQLARRKEIYEVLHPEAKAYSSEKQRQRRSQEPGEIISPGFSADTAAKTGVTPRTIRQEVQIATAIPEDVKERIRETPLANSKTDLLTLARMPVATQREAVSMIAAGTAKDPRAAGREIRRAEKLAELAEPAPLAATEHTYPLLYADPPWRYEHCMSDSRSVEDHYPTMTLEQICSLPVGEVAGANCILFLWATSPKLGEAMRVLAAWGFDYRTCLVWVKPSIGPGYWARQRHELLLVAVRGEIPPPAPAARPDSVIEQPRGEHSAKPAIFYEIIERMYPDLPKLELFARTVRPGWAVWGNEIPSDT